MDGNVDTGTGILGHNMFLYCDNNPVIRTDSTGGNWLKDAWDNFTTDVKNMAIKFVAEIIVDIITYDQDNTDLQKVLDANWFSSYKGVPVLKFPKGNNGCSVGIIIVGDTVDTETIKHEYGHRLQLDQMGTWNYIKKVAIPSATIFALSQLVTLDYDYYGAPFEAEADALGGVNRTYNNTPWPDGFYNSYWDLVGMFFT